MTASTGLADFRRPPVIEVVLGIEFQPIPNLGAAQLTRLADSWADRYPHLEELPALPPSPVPGARGGFAGALVSVGAPALRLWRLSPDRDRLLQVQRDRLVLNWRRHEGEGAYPHYAQLRPDFEVALRETDEFLSGNRLGSIRGSVAEVVYVNRLAQERSQAAGLRRTVRGGWPASERLGDPDAIQLNQSWDRGVGDRPATLSMTADSTPTDGAVLSWTYREALASASGSADALAALDRGHEAIVTSFAETTTDEMHVQWERIR